LLDCRIYVRRERREEGEKSEYVKMRMDKERETEENKKQGETKSTIHLPNQNCVGGRGAC
jgi:hypothetical protein